VDVVDTPRTEAMCNTVQQHRSQLLRTGRKGTICRIIRFTRNQECTRASFTTLSVPDSGCRLHKTANMMVGSKSYKFVSASSPHKKREAKIRLYNGAQSGMNAALLSVLSKKGFYY
jgi:hypothetical protein